MLSEILYIVDFAAEKPFVMYDMDEGVDQQIFDEIENPSLRFFAKFMPIHAERKYVLCDGCHNTIYYI